jgi:hypothetical protein
MHGSGVHASSRLAPQTSQPGRSWRIRPFPAVLLGVVLAVNTVLALSERVAGWWSRENDPTSTSLPGFVHQILAVRPVSSSDADVHMVMWLVAGLVACAVVRPWRARSWLLLAVFAYSAFLEACQGLFTNRQAEWIDLLGNALGLALAASITYLVGTHLWPAVRKTTSTDTDLA